MKVLCCQVFLCLIVHTYFHLNNPGFVWIAGPSKDGGVGPYIQVRIIHLRSYSYLVLWNILYFGICLLVLFSPNVLNFIGGMQNNLFRFVSALTVLSLLYYFGFKRVCEPGLISKQQGHAYRCFCSENRLEVNFSQWPFNCLTFDVFSFFMGCCYIFHRLCENFRWSKALTLYTTDFACPWPLLRWKKNSMRNNRLWYAWRCDRVVSTCGFIVLLMFLSKYIWIQVRPGITAFEDIIRGHMEVSERDIDDQVLLKSDGFPTYHLANVLETLTYVLLFVIVLCTLFL